MYTSDFHIHTEHSYDSACMPVPELVRGAAAAGVTCFGITDHFNSEAHLENLQSSRAAFLQNACEGMFFGVEATVVPAGELYPGKGEEPAMALTQEIAERFKISYVVAGAHRLLAGEYTRANIIADYHRQNMYLARHPLVDIVAHPWWWSGLFQDEDGTFKDMPWFDNFNAIPASMHNEFAAALKENETCCECNLTAFVLKKQYPEKIRRQYVEYLRALFESGVKITIGSDCHAAVYADLRDEAALMLQPAGFRPGDFSHPRLRNV